MRNTERIASSQEVRGLIETVAGGKVAAFCQKYPPLSQSTVYNWLREGVSRSADSDNLDAFKTAMDEAEQLRNDRGGAADPLPNTDRLRDDIRDALRFIDHADIAKLWNQAMDMMSEAQARRRPDAAKKGLEALRIAVVD